MRADRALCPRTGALVADKPRPSLESVCEREEKKGPTKHRGMPNLSLADTDKIGHWALNLSVQVGKMQADLRDLERALRAQPPAKETELEAYDLALLRDIPEVAGWLILLWQEINNRHMRDAWDYEARLRWAFATERVAKAWRKRHDELGTMDLEGFFKLLSTFLDRRKGVE